MIIEPPVPKDKTPTMAGALSLSFTISYFFTPNLYTVVDVYIFPGFSSVLGNEG